MPREVRLSLWLFVGSFFTGLALASFEKSPVIPPLRAPIPFAVIVIIGLIALFVWFFVSIYRRRNWARWLQAVFMLSGVPMSVRYIAEQFDWSPLAGSISTLTWASALIATGLLFLPTANAWYREAKAS